MEQAPQAPLEYTKEWRVMSGPWTLTSLSINLPGTPFATIEETWSLVPGPAAQGTNAPTKETVQLMGPGLQQTGRATIHKRPAQKTSSAMARSQSCGWRRRRQRATV